MDYIKQIKQRSEYQGESLDTTISRGDGTPWADTETAEYKIYNTTGTIVSSGNLTKSSDGKQFRLFVGTDETKDLSGRYKLLVWIKDSNDTEVNDVIAEYNIEYKPRRAT